jgi:hypothetical protein
MTSNDNGARVATLVVGTQEFFKEAVGHALSQTKVKATPLTESYLVALLNQFMTIDRLFKEDAQNGVRQRETLAEMFLKATNSPPGVRVELLKELGDSSLYISGFFGDSLNRKLVDLDYYVEMGGTAYGTLAAQVREESFKHVYSELAEQFAKFVDVLTYISIKALMQTNEDLLRLYDRYLRTGSDLAKEQLLEKGLLPVSSPVNRKYET